MDLAPGSRVSLTAPRNNARDPGLVSAHEPRVTRNLPLRQRQLQCYDTSTPSFAVRWAKSSLKRFVIGPTLPSPMIRLSILMTPASSPIVPVQKISSAP